MSLNDKLAELVKILSGAENAIEEAESSSLPKLTAAELEELERGKAERDCEFLNSEAGHLNEYDNYDCDICKNRGVIYVAVESEIYKHKEIRTRTCSCIEMRSMIKRARASGLGNIISEYTFAKYSTPEPWQQSIKATAQEFCVDKGARMFYIGGQSGLGKTHLCTAICRSFIKDGKSCRYMLWRDEIVKLKQLVNEYEEYQSMMDELKNADVLYIDDLFKVQSGTTPTSADINIAFELINNRIMANDKVTIISSEHTIAEALKFDEATVGRIYQAAGKYKISIDRDIKKNYRLTK